MNIVLLRVALLAGVCASLGTGGCIHITNTYAGPPSITERTTETRSIADVRDCGCNHQMGGYIPYFPPSGSIPSSGYSQDGYAHGGHYYYPAPYGYPYSGYPYPYGSQPTSTPTGSGAGGARSSSDQRGGYESGERRDVGGGMERPVEIAPTARRDAPLTDATPTYHPEDHRTPATTHDAPGPRATDDNPMTSGGRGGVSVGRRDEGMIGGEGIGKDPGIRGTDGMRRDEGMRSQDKGDMGVPTKPVETPVSVTTKNEGMQSREQRDMQGTPKPAEVRNNEGVQSREQRDVPAVPKPVEVRDNEGMQSREQRDVPAVPKPVEVRNNEGVQSREQRDVPAVTKPADTRSDEGVQSREQRKVEAAPKPVDTRRTDGVHSQPVRDVPAVTKPVENKPVEMKRDEGVRPQEQRDVQVTTKPTDGNGSTPKVIQEAPATPSTSPGTEAGVRRPASDTSNVSQARRKSGDE